VFLPPFIRRERAWKLTTKISQPEHLAILETQCAIALLTTMITIRIRFLSLEWKKYIINKNKENWMMVKKTYPSYSFSGLLSGHIFALVFFSCCSASSCHFRLNFLNHSFSKAGNGSTLSIMSRYSNIGHIGCTSSSLCMDLHAESSSPPHLPYIHFLIENV